jgi:hypothetical protein
MQEAKPDHGRGSPAIIAQAFARASTRRSSKAPGALQCAAGARRRAMRPLIDKTSESAIVDNAIRQMKTAA